MKTTLDLINWKFHLGEIKMYEYHSHDVIYDMAKAGGKLGSKDAYLTLNEWQDITVPHDYCIAQDTDRSCAPSHGYKPRNVGWYYTTFDLPENFDGTALIDFEGVSNECEVYVNSTLVCRNYSGYTGFICDVSDYLKPAENTITLRVDSSHWEGWWYEGSGIYRPARIHFCDKAYLMPMETYVKTEKVDGGWRIHAEYDLIGDGEVTLTLADMDGNVVHDGATDFVLADAKLWSPDEPYLYTATLTVRQSGEVCDTASVRIGLREIEWRVDGGMYLNGEKCLIKGICCHQDHSGVGIAVPRELIYWRVNKLRELGCNAYRVAHHNPSREFLDVCDELGMLVMSENRKFGSSEEILAETRYMVKNCRNHPSVFLYSLFNEEPWQKEIRGKRFAEKLTAEIHKYDTSRATTGAINLAENIDGESAADVLDVMGMNYSIHKYEKLYNYQKKVVLGTENGPVYATRGEVNTDYEAQVYGNYGDECPTWGQTIEDTLETAKVHPWVAGVFLWSGFDYRGEPQPMEWPSVSSHWGVCDICGFEKDIYYLVKSYYRSEPVLHLLPKWEGFKRGEEVRVATFTNMDKVTLYVNGRDVGTVTVKECRAEWRVPFEAGEIRAVGVRGDERATDVLVTPGAPAKLVVDVIGQGRHKAINVTVCDENGVHVSCADNVVKIAVEGGTLIGCGNGNPNDPMPGICHEVKTFHGKCQFIVEGVGARATLSADELLGVSI